MAISLRVCMHTEIYDQKGKKRKHIKEEADEFYKKHWNYHIFSNENFKKHAKEWSNATCSRKTVK